MSNKKNKFAKFQNNKLSSTDSKNVKGGRIGRVEGAVECDILGGTWYGHWCDLD